LADGATETPDRSTGGTSSTAVDQTAPTSTATSNQTSAPSGTPPSETNPAPTDQEGTDTEDQTTTTVPASTSGLRTSTTRTSEWDDGYCFQMDVTNQAGDGDGWRVVLDLGGSIDTIWNATATAAGDQTVFSGEAGYNTDLAPGASTSFGACVTTDP
jgi:cellulase/cellobiase CelA1